MGGWEADTGSTNLARIYAAGRYLLAGYDGRPLPGRVIDGGGGFLVFDEMALNSLRIYRVVHQGDAEFLTGAGGERWEIRPVSPERAALLEATPPP